MYVCISTSCQSQRADAKQIVHKVQNVSQPISKLKQATYTLNRINPK